MLIEKKEDKFLSKYSKTGYNLHSMQIFIVEGQRGAKLKNFASTGWKKFILLILISLLSYLLNTNL